MQPACKERLYLPRSEMGRGLHNIEFKSGTMLLQLRNTLEDSKLISTRRGAILKTEEKSVTHLATICNYLRSKYAMEETVDVSGLQKAQSDSLYSEIKKKQLHEKLYRPKENPLVDIKGCSMWLSHGNIKPRDEASICNLQDRNFFLGAISKCNHCNQALKTVDHLASKCDRMLAHDYTRRHNEVVRCIHLLLCNKYNIKSSKKMRTHSVQEIVSNEYVEIKVDTTVKTDIKVQNNRPDIIVHDKKRHEITLIEVGITNQDLLQTVEVEKCRKYDLLAGELGQMYKCKTKIIPYVVSWDGIVTSYHKKYIKELGITKNIEAYIQSRILKKTLESVSFESRRGLTADADTEAGFKACDKVKLMC